MAMETYDLIHIVQKPYLPNIPYVALLEQVGTPIVGDPVLAKWRKILPREEIYWR
jgi:hypothetical protein